MAITIKTEPNEFSAGYSAIPLRVLSDETDVENLKYNIQVTYQESEYASSVPVDYNGLVYTKITTVLDHGYTLGDVVLFYNPVTESYSGTYIVKEIVSSTEFVIDLVLGAPIVATSTSYFYRIIPYSMLPDEDYEAKLDLSNSIKDFVTQDIEDTGEIYEALNTFFEYGLTIGTEYKYVFEFEDNFFNAGNVGFNNTSGTALDVANSPFKIGDQINIQQDLYEWTYDDNTFSAGDLAFTSALVDHNIPLGTQINVTGQITEPSYNGATTVTEIIDAKTIKVNKPFIASTPAEGGSIFGVITPSYNTVGTITDIYYDAVLGYVIETNIPYTIATPPIGGKIKFADGRISDFPIEEKVDDLVAYNSVFTKRQYEFSGNDFDSYVVQARTFDENNLSTILSQMDVKNLRFRIEPSSKSWLLCQSKDVGVFKANPLITCFNSSDVVISEFRINNYQDFDNFYFPIGIEQMILNSNTTLISGSSLSTVKDDVSYYRVELDRNTNVASNNIVFEVNDDCSRYDIYHLCWKDAFGSWLSYPFKYIQKNITEAERKVYYQKEGRFDLDNDTFGYDGFSRGDTNYYNRYRDKMILNSGWVEEFENEIIKDLFNSSNVMVQEPDGLLVACTINTNKQEFFKKQTDYLFQYQFEITLSSNEYRK